MKEEPLEVLATVERITEKLRTITSDATKLVGDFGKELLKICVTLNGGGLIAFPTFYKAIFPTSSLGSDFYWACGCFGAGVAVGGVAMITAFVLLTRALRASIYSMMLPMLQTQKALSP